MKNTIITLASVAALASAANAQTVVLTDNTLNTLVLEGFTESAGVDSPNTSRSYVAQGTGGNSGSFAELGLVTSWDGVDPSGATQFSFYEIPGMAFDPTVLGKDITSITFSAQDKGLTQFIGLGFTAYQGGVRYTNSGGGNTATAGQDWTTFSATTSTLGSLDLSATGGIITFGLYTHNGVRTVAPGYSSSLGVDNYSVAIKVPEPSSTALLGLGALGLIARRKR